MDKRDSFTFDKDPATGRLKIPSSPKAVDVFLKDTVTRATLYEDDEVTTKTNPFNTDADGEYAYKVRNGFYDEVVNSENFNDIFFRDTLDTKILTSNHTITASDVETLLLVKGVLQLTLTIPRESTESLPQGFRVYVMDVDGNGASFSTEGTDTLNNFEDRPANLRQYALFSLIKVEEGDPSSWIFLRSNPESLPMFSVRSP